MAGIAGAVLIAVGLLGGGLAGVYIDKTKKFEETAKVAYGLAAVSCALFAVVSLSNIAKSLIFRLKCEVSW